MKHTSREGDDEANDNTEKATNDVSDEGDDTSKETTDIESCDTVGVLLLFDLQD
jgi:hypothetical protein